VIGLVDYGAGNLTSVKKALTALGAAFKVPDTPEDCADVSGLIVPGVGHFSATTALGPPWRDAIRGAVEAGTPLLGICVGMQWLFEGSEEAPDVPGLGVLKGRCRLLRGDVTQRVKVPHVGWNALEPPSGLSENESARTDAAGTGSPTFRGQLLAGLPSHPHVYFTHSFAAPVTDDCVASTTHAEHFAAAVERDRVFGVQFHPEKSGDAGLQILRNFLALCQ
jgi:imidazole glycerol-phosphate synthase subunit HisH